MSKIQRDKLSYGSTDNPYLQQTPQEDLDFIERRKRNDEELETEKKKVKEDSNE